MIKIDPILGLLIEKNLQSLPVSPIPCGIRSLFDAVKTPLKIVQKLKKSLLQKIEHFVSFFTLSRSRSSRSRSRSIFLRFSFSNSR
jgi:hypothetical protein